MTRVLTGADRAVAIGSDSVASDADTVSFGHLATDEDEINGAPYGSDLQRRLVNVADGIGDHDAATVGQLASFVGALGGTSEEHTSELQALMRTSYAVFCLTKTNA